MVTFEIMSTREKTKRILLNKSLGQPLGIQLASEMIGSLPVVTIKKIAPSSPAHASGKLQCVNIVLLIAAMTMFCRAGDQLVSVNGMRVFGMSVEQVKGLLATISSNEIEFEVLNVYDPRYL